MTTILKKKKKEMLLLTSYEAMPLEDIMKTLAEIRKELFRIFKNHIGRENAISPYELFYEVFGVKADTLDLYTRNYWYLVLKRVITTLRREGDIFIINNGYHLFVLRSEEELDKFKKRTDRHIKALEEVKTKAEEWIDGKKWRYL